METNPQEYLTHENSSGKGVKRPTVLRLLASPSNATAGLVKQDEKQNSGVSTETYFRPLVCDVKTSGSIFTEAHTQGVTSTHLILHSVSSISASIMSSRSHPSVMRRDVRLSSPYRLPACSLPPLRSYRPQGVPEKETKRGALRSGGLTARGMRLSPFIPSLTHLPHPPPSPAPICILKDLQLLETPTGRCDRKLSLHRSPFSIFPSFPHTPFLLFSPSFIFFFPPALPSFFVLFPCLPFFFNISCFPSLT